MVMKVLVIVHERIELLLGIEDELPKGPLDNPNRPPPGTVSFEVNCAAPYTKAHGQVKVDLSESTIDPKILGETGHEEVQDSEASSIGDPLQASFLKEDDAAAASTEAPAEKDEPDTRRKSGGRAKVKSGRRARVSDTAEQEPAEEEAEDEDKEKDKDQGQEGSTESGLAKSGPMKNAHLFVPRDREVFMSEHDLPWYGDPLPKDVNDLVKSRGSTWSQRTSPRA